MGTAFTYDLSLPSTYSETVLRQPHRPLIVKSLCVVDNYNRCYLKGRLL